MLCVTLEKAPATSENGTPQLVQKYNIRGKRHLSVAPQISKSEISRKYHPNRAQNVSEEMPPLAGYYCDGAKIFDYVALSL